jgi:hypothetical protein
MDVKTEALKFACPACGAKPNEPCVRINGTAMPEPHTKRKAQARSISGEGVNQTSLRIVGESPEKLQ